MTVEAVIYFLSHNTTSRAGVVARADATANTYYEAYYDNGNQRWELLRVAGTSLNLGTWSETIPAGEARTMKLVITDAEKKVLVDGVERIISADNAVTVAGLVGVKITGYVGVSNTTGYHVDSIRATSP